MYSYLSHLISYQKESATHLSLYLAFRSKVGTIGSSIVKYLSQESPFHSFLRSVPHNKRTRTAKVTGSILRMSRLDTQWAKSNSRSMLIRWEWNLCRFQATFERARCGLLCKPTEWMDEWMIWRDRADNSIKSVISLSTNEIFGTVFKNAICNCKSEPKNTFRRQHCVLKGRCQCKMPR